MLMPHSSAPFFTSTALNIWQPDEVEPDAADDDCPRHQLLGPHGETPVSRSPCSDARTPAKPRGRERFRLGAPAFY